MLQATAAAAAARGGIQSKRTEEQQPNRSSFPAREHTAQDAALPLRRGRVLSTICPCQGGACRTPKGVGSCSYSSSLAGRPPLSLGLCHSDKAKDSREAPWGTSGRSGCESRWTVWQRIQPSDERQRVPSHPQGSPPAASLHETRRGALPPRTDRTLLRGPVWLLLLLLALSVEGCRKLCSSRTGASGVARLAQSDAGQPVAQHSLQISWLVLLRRPSRQPS